VSFVIFGGNDANDNKVDVEHKAKFEPHGAVSTDPEDPFAMLDPSLVIGLAPALEPELAWSVDGDYEQRSYIPFPYSDGSPETDRVNKLPLLTPTNIDEDPFAKVAPFPLPARLKPKLLSPKARNSLPVPDISVPGGISVPDSPLIPDSPLVPDAALRKLSVHHDSLTYNGPTAASGRVTLDGSRDPNGLIVPHGSAAPYGLAYPHRPVASHSPLGPNGPAAAKTGSVPLNPAASRFIPATSASAHATNNATDLTTLVTFSSWPAPEPRPTQVPPPAPATRLSRAARPTPVANPNGANCPPRSYIVNRLDERIDLPVQSVGPAAHASFQARTSALGGRKVFLCWAFHLYGRCRRRQCRDDHGPQLNPDQLTALRALTRRFKCKHSIACTVVNCPYSHHCTHGAECLQGATCKWADSHHMTLVSSSSTIPLLSGTE
jgi:hypothetical protein